MRKAFIFTPAIIAVMYGMWLAGTGVALWDVGAFLAYTVIICVTVYAFSWITSTAVFMVVTSTTLIGEIYYLLRQFDAGNIDQRTLICLLIAIITALMAERGN